MPALDSGRTAPDFTLPVLNGGKFSLQQALARRPVVLAFFKVSCPVCQYAFPFLDRIHQLHGKNVDIVGISQNNAKDTAAFAQQLGITFAILLDDTETFPVSNAYGLTNVPSVFWIGQDSKIEISSVGWSRADIDRINRDAAHIAGDAVKAVFFPDELVADFRAG
jgi:cytochrome c biogenesis protein CcmG/thiol:disulfide interchange protein DsbE